MAGPGCRGRRWVTSCRVGPQTPPTTNRNAGKHASLWPGMFFTSASMASLTPINLGIHSVAGTLGPARRALSRVSAGSDTEEPGRQHACGSEQGLCVGGCGSGPPLPAAAAPSPATNSLLSAPRDQPSELVLHFIMK